MTASTPPRPREPSRPSGPAPPSARWSRWPTSARIAVPDDLVKVDRALGAAVPAPCNRRLDVELSWKPRCACGFALGQQAASIDFDAILEITERGVLQHLAELGAEEPRMRLEAAVDHLTALGRDELAADLRQLLVFVASPVAVDRLALAHLLDGPLTPVVRDVLGGGHLVVRRDLSVLREELTGRRYPKRRLLELFGAWVDPAGDLPAGSYVEVVDSQGAQGRPDGGPHAARCSRAECCRGGHGGGDRSVPVGTISPPRGAFARGAADGVLLVGRLVD